MSEAATIDRKPVYMRLPIPLARAIKSDAAINGESVQAWIEDAARDKLERRKGARDAAE